jgi:hypothetical protein
MCENESTSKINCFMNSFNHYIKQGVEYFRFIKDYFRFKALSKSTQQRFQLLWGDIYPCLRDKMANIDFDKHYIYHPAWAARILAQTKPKLHTDISSTLYFCSIISAFIPVNFYDYRPPRLHLDNLHINSIDLIDLPFEDRSITSLSCMHVIEHIGLGRYGDPLDPNGDLNAMAELSRVITPKGNLLIVVPVGGIPRIMFNAHRIYSYSQIIMQFSDFELREFSLIPDNDLGEGLIVNASKELADACTYGCGCFWFIKNK